MRDPQSVQQLLHRLPQKVGNAWLARVQSLADINRSLPLWCEEPWVRQIRIANIREQTVVVFSASASALVPLRHRSGSLLIWLNDRYRITCTRVETRVRPPVCGLVRVYRPAPQ